MEYIKYKDKEYPFLFAWSTFKKFSKMDLDKTDDMDIMDKGIYLGFEHGAKKENVKVFSFDEMLDMFDEDEQFQEQANSFFLERFLKHRKRTQEAQSKLLSK